MNFRLVSLCLITTFLWGCHMFQEKSIPEELLGQWETSEPRYERCAFEIGKEMIIFRNELKHVVFYHITKVNRAAQRGQTLYRIYYETADGLEYELPISYKKTKDGAVIRFQNQQDIDWVKTQVFS